MKPNEETWMYIFCRNGTITKIGYADRELSSDELEPLRELISRPEFSGFRLLHNILFIFDSCSPGARITGDIIDVKWRYVNVEEVAIDGGNEEKKKNERD